MVTRSVRVNTFFKQKKKPFVDFLSMLYILTASILGLNRLAVVLNESKYIIVFLAVGYSVLLTTAIIYFTYDFNVVVLMSIVEYIFVIAFSCLSWKRMERYYNELNKFDFEIGCRPKLTVAPIRNFIYMIVLNGFFTVLSVLYKFIHIGVACQYWSPGILTNVVHCLELYYYGHLLSLLVPRLCLINYFVESALATGSSVKHPKIEEFRSYKSKMEKNTNMKKLMDLYHIVIKSYDFLVEAIKWQLVVILITTFISTLEYCYELANELIQSELTVISALSRVQLMTMEMFPLFSPCIFADRVHAKVRRFRELLASRLYENKLDKSGRSAARALLALTEARDLSFSLLRVLQVDVSLPFKFIGLLVTYLIIMLQFQKVISPQPSTSSTMT